METQRMLGAWLAQCKERAKKESSGAFAAKDAVRVPVLFEWILTDIQSPDCAEIKRQIADLGCHVVVPLEVAFLKARPEAVTTDHFLKACEPFFAKKDTHVDWDGVTYTIDGVMRHIYTANISQFPPDVIKRIAQDLYLFVTVKDVQTDELLGFISCGITPASAFGDVKVITCAVAPQNAHRGLDAMLFAAVLKILPATQRIFLATRPTNTQGIVLYKSFGFQVDQEFTQDPNHQVAFTNYTILECAVGKDSSLRSIL